MKSFGKGVTLLRDKPRSMIVFLRVIPFLIGFLEAVIFWYQRDNPVLYPWLILSGAALFFIAALALSWGRIKIKDMLEKVTPNVILLLALGFGLLLIESDLERLIVTLLAAISSTVVLDLLFLLSFRPVSYPVNGLSHLNIAMVPVIAWYAMSTSTGLITFLHSNSYWHVIMGTWHITLGVVLGLILFRLTGHPGATRAQNSIWMAVGAFTGLEVSLAGLILPVSLSTQGLLAALFFTAALRVRRYLYAPKPSRRLAISEVAAGLILFSTSLMTARWL